MCSPSAADTGRRFRHPRNSCLREFPGNYLFRYLPHRQRDDDVSGLAEERVDFGQGVVGVVERDEERLPTSSGARRPSAAAAPFSWSVRLVRHPHKVRRAASLVNVRGRRSPPPAPDCLLACAARDGARPRFAFGHAPHSRTGFGRPASQPCQRRPAPAEDCQQNDPPRPFRWTRPAFGRSRLRYRRSPPAAARAGRMSLDICPCHAIWSVFNNGALAEGGEPPGGPRLGRSLALPADGGPILNPL